MLGKGENGDPAKHRRRRGEAGRKSIAIFLLAVVASIFPSPLLADPRPPLKIGVDFALTGEASYWANQQLKGIQLARDELAATGTPIDLVIEDSGTSAQGSVTAFNKLTSVDHVDAVIGNIWAQLTEPLVPLAEQRKVPLITPEPVCKPGMSYSFAGGPQFSRLSSAYSAFFRRNPNIKTAAIVNFDDPDWGAVHRDAWRKAAAGAGVSEVGHVESADLNPDFRPLFLPLLRNSPAAMFIVQEPSASMRALAELHYSGAVVQSNAVTQLMLTETTNLPELEGVYFADTRANQKFRTAFTAHYHVPPVLDAETGYEILRSIAKAADANRANLAAGMRRVQYAGVAGLMDFRSGCAGNQASWHLYRFSRGRPKFIE
jgi:ABC-type branched-subunit amino acid transport system substrate-binding protein